MRYKTEVIEELLKSLSLLEEFYEPPEVICNQFTNWLNTVCALLDGEDMGEECNIWNKAIKGVRFSSAKSLLVAMSTAKAALFRILNKLRTTEIFKTPYLNDEDIANAYKMSEMYVVIHCYENSVRRFIEDKLKEEFGSNWWEKVANTEPKKCVNERKEKETKNKWISPRGISPLYYLQWGDLAKIIRSNEQLFLPYIGSTKFVESRFEDLEKLRNIVAHNGIVSSEDDFQRAIIAFRDWCRQIAY